MVYIKILITTDLYKPSVNGVVTSITNLIEEIEKYGHEVKVLAISDRKRNYVDGNTYNIKSVPLRLYPTTRFPVTFARRYLKEIVEWQPHIVHSQCEFFSFEFAEYISKWTGAPIVHTYHTLYEQYSKYILNGKIVKPSLIAGFSKERLRKVAAIIAPTEKTRAKLLEYGCKNRIEVIPTGINMDRFLKRISKEKKALLKQKYNIPENAPLLVYVGRLGFEKSINELIDGFEIILKKNRDAYFLIVGDGPARPSLIEQSADRNVNKRIIFTGMINYDEVPDYYQLGDVFVCASTSEAQGLTYVEAAASGLPLLCKEDLALVGVLENGKNGYAFKTIGEFASLAEKILADKEFQENSWEYNSKVVERYSKKQFGASVNKLYKEVWRDTKEDERDKKHILELLEYFKDSKS